MSPTHSEQESKQLCRWLGPSFDKGAELCYACATARGKVLIRSSVIPLTKEERNSEDVKEIKRNFTEELKNRLKERADAIKVDGEDNEDTDDRYIRPLDEDGVTPTFEPYEDDDMEPFEEPPSEEDHPIEFDKYVGVKVRKNMDGKDLFGVVKDRKRRLDGQWIGHYHANPRLDTCIYKIKWHDFEFEAYRANEVIEAMLMNVACMILKLRHIELMK